MRLLAALLFTAAIAGLDAQEGVQYKIRFPDPQTHYVEIEATVPAKQSGVELMMPVWTPGSYLIREYSRHVDAFAAKDPDGRSLAWEKTRKNRWRVEPGLAKTVHVTYRVYARDRSVQGNWVDAGFAMMNGAPNFMTLAGDYKRPHSVTIELPQTWNKIVTGLKEVVGRPLTFQAEDYDELVDSPIYAGNAPVYEFTVRGKPHFLVNEGEPSFWDGAASAQAVQKIVEECARMFGELPYEKYVFFNMIVEAGGGLEHRNSTWMNTSRWAWSNTRPPSATDRRPSRTGWLGLVSHEYFHAWNVKRLRPIELGPFDYENETYSRSLWVAEGLTSYYGPLILRRAGLTTTPDYLRALSGTIAALQSTEGRKVIPVETASYDAWIRLYRPDENTPNTNISYYTKGAVIAFLLDVKIRQLTGGSRSLDDVMRLAYVRHSGAAGYTSEEFRKAASDVAGTDLTVWFQSVLESTSELEYQEALDWYGLRFTPNPGQANTSAGFELGMTTDLQAGVLRVTQIRRGGAAYRAGINVDDEILAVDEYRVTPALWPNMLNAYSGKQAVPVLISRRGKLARLSLPLIPEKPQPWNLSLAAEPSPAQTRNLSEWVRGTASRER